MGAITISRQMGSYGDEIALQLARRLGWRLVCRELINRSALAAGVPQVALAEIDELGFFGVHPSPKEWQAYQSQVERFIRDLADEGKVIIVGRGGQVALRDRPETVHVRIMAPFETRVARLQAEINIPAAAARARLAESLKRRAHYLRQSYGVKVDDPALYHLTLNTGLLTVSQGANLILHAFQSLIEQGQNYTLKANETSL